MKKSKYTKIVSLSLLLGFTLGIEAKVAARFESVSGMVQYREKGGKWQAAKISTVLNTNTELQTGPTGKATLVFPNGSKVSLTPGTLASLDQYSTGSYGSQTNMSLRMGRLNADIAKVNDVNVRNHFRVRTPTVVAGVRGTVEQVGYTPDKGSDVVLVESSADVVDGSGRATVVPQGGSSQVTTGGTITADQKETQSSTVTMAGQGATAAEASMSFTAGDFTFSGNFSDFDDLFSLFDLFDAYEFGFGTEVTFEKL
jgi:hypothetical protein